MPLDAVTVSALTRELRERIEGGRIDKVQQPERDMLLISLRAKGDNLRLVIAAGTGNARVHLTSGGFENPAEPPMFCMLMRKHLVGARIPSVEQPELERMVVLTLDTHDELGVSAEKKACCGAYRPQLERDPRRRGRADNRLHAPHGLRRGRAAPSAAGDDLPSAARAGKARVLCRVR